MPKLITQYYHFYIKRYAFYYNKINFKYISNFDNVLFTYLMKYCENNKLNTNFSVEFLVSVGNKINKYINKGKPGSYLIYSYCNYTFCPLYKTLEETKYKKYHNINDFTFDKSHPSFFDIINPDSYLPKAGNIISVELCIQGSQPKNLRPIPDLYLDSNGASHTKFL